MSVTAARANARRQFEGHLSARASANASPADREGTRSGASTDTEPSPAFADAGRAEKRVHQAVASIAVLVLLAIVGLSMVGTGDEEGNSLSRDQVRRAVLVSTAAGQMCDEELDWRSFGPRSRQKIEAVAADVGIYAVDWDRTVDTARNACPEIFAGYEKWHQAQEARSSRPSNRGSNGEDDEEYEVIGPDDDVPQDDYDGEGDYCLSQNDLTWDLYRSGQISRREFQISMQELEAACGWS